VRICMRVGMYVCWYVFMYTAIGWRTWLGKSWSLKKREMGEWMRLLGVPMRVCQYVYMYTAIIVRGEMENVARERNGAGGRAVVLLGAHMNVFVVCIDVYCDYSV
jgi:hypothetical protein